MPTLHDHKKATFSQCRKILPDRIGCGGFVFWGPADGPAARLGLEGCCSHCGTLWYTADLLNTPSEPRLYVGTRVKRLSAPHWGARRAA